MSDSSFSPRDVRSKGRVKSSIIWFSLSFLLSALIVAWAFTLPFRQSDTPLASSPKPQDVGKRFDLSDRIMQRHRDAQEFRAAAITMNEEFMQSLAESRKQEPVPGIKQVRVNWNRRVERVKHKVARLKYAREGSVEWEYKQDLLDSLADAPQ